MTEQQESKRTTTRPITSFELWRMPEFKALCKAIGAEYYVPIGDGKDSKSIGMIIEIPADIDGLVQITQRYQARPGFREKMEMEAAIKLVTQLKQSEAELKSDEPALVDTTTQHNKVARTYAPTRTG